MSLTDVRMVIADLTARVVPLDDEEADAQRAMLAWIGAGAPLFRTVPPDIPPMHLAVYVVLLDAGGRAVLLVDHIKAGLWLPPGGHVDPDEDPRATAVREGKEELGLDIDFHEGAGDRPFFVTVTATRGPDIMNSRGVSRGDVSRLTGCWPRAARMRVRSSGGTHVSQDGRLPLQKRHRGGLSCGRTERPVTTGSVRKIRLEVRGALAGRKL